MTEKNPSVLARKSSKHPKRRKRKDLSTLSIAARTAGVEDRLFGVFHDAGYKGLYGGLGAADIKTRKSIPVKEQLMDRMDTTELAANQFRMTQTRDKLAREGIRGADRAIDTHHAVGQEVRQAIQRIGGTLPENIPPAEPIKRVRKRLAATPEKLRLEDREAKGLAGEQNEIGGRT